MKHECCICEEKATFHIYLPKGEKHFCANCRKLFSEAVIEAMKKSVLQENSKVKRHDITSTSTNLEVIRHTSTSTNQG